MYMQSDKPLLTLAQMQGWQAQADRLAEEIRGKTAELASLTRRIETAKAFVASLPDDEQVSFEATNTSISAPSGDDGCAEIADTQEDSISGGILAAVAALGGAPKPAVIRRWIAKNNVAVDTKLVARPGYLYTALMRHVRATPARLVKRGKGYRLPASSPKGEAGGVAPPADSVTSPSTTCGPSQAAPEAGGI
jgi:hypothetical protein